MDNGKVYNIGNRSRYAYVYDTREKNAFDIIIQEIQ